MLEILISKKQNKERIALIENGNLVEYYEEDENENRKEGNIYKGKIKDIIPGMQSAFVDIGAERSGFIHIKDILPKVDEKNKTNVEIQETKIRKLVKQNQDILVQVKKDSNEKRVQECLLT